MRKITILFLFLSLHLISIGRNVPDAPQKPNKVIELREDCANGTQSIQQKINNVRATLLNSGDCWWNLDEGQYFVPNTPAGIEDVSSIFAASVWIGGYDDAGNLKIAANQYRSTGNSDFFPGPLNDFTGTTEEEVCKNWDQFFIVYGDEIKLHIANFKTNGPLEVDSIPDNIRYWPGRGNSEFPKKYGFDLPNNTQGLGNYFDQNDNGIYDPINGDFPVIEVRGCNPANPQYPDEMIYWIYNDAGGAHKETNGQAIQMEVQVQAFAFQSTDELNDMTFQRYKLINRAQTVIQDCYFAFWVDADLGCAEDDYIGCDVDRSLMYTYNEDATDGTTAGSCSCDSGSSTYCTEVPILGIDYFRGPLKPVNIVIEPDGMGGLDTTYVDIMPGEDGDTLIELGMSSFTYFNNPGFGNPPAATTDPETPIQFYNYMNGRWKDGTPFTFGGSSYNIGSTDTIRYAFVGDPNNDNGWSMCSADLPFSDRRTVQASGPFILKQNAINELIVGVVWVPDQAYPCPDLGELRKADDLAQALFDNCFETLDGPDPPQVDFIQLDREIVLLLSNDTIISNNRDERYMEVDIYATDSLAKPLTDAEKSYKFEGYLIYQLARLGQPSDFYDTEQARLIRNVDFKNNVTTLYNWTSTINPLPGNNEPVYTAERKVEGIDNGIQHSFRILDDAFGSDDGRLVNHKEYYYTVLAYGFNEYAPFQPDEGLGQKTTFIVGSGNSFIRVVPRPMVYDNLNTFYGDGPVVTRLQGVGNQGQFIELADGMHEQILEENSVKELVYKEGASPLRVKIVNPLGVQDGDFRLEIGQSFDEDTGEVLVDESTWTLTDLNTDKVYKNIKTLDTLDETIIRDYGFSIQIGKEPGVSDEKPADYPIYGNFIGSSMTFSDQQKGDWLRFVPSGASPINYIDNEAKNKYDTNGRLSNTGGLNMFPLEFAAFNAPIVTPANRHNTGRATQGQSQMLLERLPNVDIVMTSDKSKWSRCIVMEAANEDYTDFGFFSEGGANMYELRNHPSVGKDADSDGNPIELGDGTTGYGYFPGYAIDVETGDRLNIFFAENSVYGGEYNEFLDVDDVGRDMMFNPSSQLLSAVPLGSVPGSLFPAVLGGQHFIYVSKTKYDGCEQLGTYFAAGASNANYYRGIRGLTWTGIPVSSEDVDMLSYADGLIPNDVTISLRLDNTLGYAEKWNTENTQFELVEENPIYEFSIRGKEAEKVEADEIDEALAQVNVVPNPYYANSAYELTQNDSRVKITNVPRRGVITIYSLDGRFITQFKRDAKRIANTNPTGATNFSQEGPDVIWDIKNSKGIPVASGVYLIHVIDEETGAQRTVKWFGINRKFDPDGL